MSQMLYPVVLALYAWTSGANPEFDSDPAFDRFSTSYCAMALFVVLMVVCIKKDLSVFMRASAYGIIFLFMLTVYIVVSAIKAFTNTEFHFGTYQEAQ